MADNTEHNRSDRAGSGRHLTTIFLTLFIILLAGAGYFGVRFWAGHAQDSAGRLDNTVSEQKKIQADIGPIVELSEFLVNIISEDNSHYLRASIAIEVSSSDTQEELIQRMPQVRDAILLLISNKTFEELYDLHGKKQLKAEILLTVDSLISSGEVTAVYLTDFIVQ